MHGSNEQGEYCRKRFCNDLTITKNSYINHLLYFTFTLHNIYTVHINVCQMAELEVWLVTGNGRKNILSI